MPYVLRIEKDEVGMYTAFPSFSDILCDINVNSLLSDHPEPCDDFSWHYFSQMGEKHFFGFKNIEQLKNWTINDDIRNTMDEYGFEGLVYHVINPDHILYGDTQIAFIKDQSTCVDRFSLANLNINYTL